MSCDRGRLYGRKLADGLRPVAAKDALEDGFHAPPAAAKPRVRWWWPGGAVADAELKREIAILSKAGFGGAEIQAFNPGIPDLTPEERAHVNDYATPHSSRTSAWPPTRRRRAG